MTFKLNIPHDNIVIFWTFQFHYNSNLLSVLARYAHGPPGVRSSAVIFKRILSIVTVADEVKKKM